VCALRWWLWQRQCFLVTQGLVQFSSGVSLSPLADVEALGP
jgi:hypothetical protein